MWDEMNQHVRHRAQILTTLTDLTRGWQNSYIRQFRASCKWHANDTDILQTFFVLWNWFCIIVFSIHVTPKVVCHNSSLLICCCVRTVICYSFKQNNSSLLICCYVRTVICYSFTKYYLVSLTMYMSGMMNVVMLF